MNPNFDELIAVFKYEQDAKMWVADHTGEYHTSKSRYYIMETDRGYEVYQRPLRDVLGWY